MRREKRAVILRGSTKVEMWFTSGNDSQAGQQHLYSLKKEAFFSFTYTSFFLVKWVELYLNVKLVYLSVHFNKLILRFKSYFLGILFSEVIRLWMGILNKIVCLFTIRNAFLSCRLHALFFLRVDWKNWKDYKKELSRFALSCGWKVHVKFKHSEIFHYKRQCIV